MAAVVSPSSETGGNIIVEEPAKAIEINSRPFTEAERKSIQRAFIVPSQDGLAVCLRRKNGSEDFLPLDDKSTGSAWDEVNLKRMVVITYQDEVQKLKILHRKSWSLFDLFHRRN